MKENQNDVLLRRHSSCGPPHDDTEEYLLIISAVCSCVRLLKEKEDCVLIHRHSFYVSRHVDIETGLLVKLCNKCKMPSTEKQLSDA